MALAYINKFGSVQFQHLSAISVQFGAGVRKHFYICLLYIIYRKFRGWCWISNRRSRYRVDSLRRGISHSVSEAFDIDLFASLINNKCENVYVSWFPDPGSIAVDTFTFSWEGLNFYAFPPFILLPCVLRKIVDDKVAGTLVVLWSLLQVWFPLFCRLLISKPLIVWPNYSLLSSPFRHHHLAWKTLSLGVVRLSGKRLRIA